MIYIECPNKLPKELECYCLSNCLFLAGGVSNCRDWQKEVLSKILDLDIVVLNPRRAEFDASNKEIEKEQIQWEYEMLRKASVISFYFCEETICPITLYELGTWSHSDKQIIIGMDEKYSRRRDVEIQSSLIRPMEEIVYNLQDLVKEIRNRFAYSIRR